MVGTVDLRSAHGPTLDEAPWLGAYLQQIVGQPFLFFREPYGGELTMHLGTPVIVQPPSPKLKPKTRGTYVLTFRGSAWSLVSGPKASLTMTWPFPSPEAVAGRPIELKELEKSSPVLPGAPVLWAVPGLAPAGFGILLSFADGSRLALMPDPTPEALEDEELPPIADWELFTPHGMYLKVGPGPKWGYLPSRSETVASGNGGRPTSSGPGST
jgi:hypothetical protein